MREGQPAQGGSHLSIVLLHRLVHGILTVADDFVHIVFLVTAARAKTQYILHEKEKVRAQTIDNVEATVTTRSYPYHLIFEATN